MLPESDQYSVAVIDLVLDNLCLEPFQQADVLFHLRILPGEPDELETFCFPFAFQGEAAFLRFIFPGTGEDFRIQHGDNHRSPGHGDNAFPDSDHIGGHADTPVQVGAQRIRQVHRDLEIRRRGRDGFSGEENRVMYNRPDHLGSSFHPGGNVGNPPDDGCFYMRRFISCIWKGRTRNQKKSKCRLQYKQLYSIMLHGKESLFLSYHYSSDLQAEESKWIPAGGKAWSMNALKRRNHGLHRILAVLLCLMLLFQHVGVYAEEPGMTGTAPAITEPAEEIAETPAGADAAPGENAGTPAEILPEGNEVEEAGNAGEGDPGTPDTEDAAPEEQTAAAEPTPIIDTSESITMFMPGFSLQPAYFEGTLVHNGPDYTVTAVIGKDAMLPADIAMRVAEVLPGTEMYEFYREMMAETLEEDEEMGEFARLFDIAFIAVIDGEETEIEPATDIDVQITFAETIAVTEEIDVQAVHFDENTPEVMDVSTDSLAAAANDDEAIDTLSFSSGSFSIYGFFQKVKKVIRVITASGETFTIDVSFTSDSGIPDDAELTAAEITPDDPVYEAYRAQALDALEAGAAGKAFFFDIRISKDGEKIEPSGPVTVAITLDEMPEETAEVAVVHFGKEATEVIEGVAVSESDIQFQAESFSVYGVVVSPGPATANNLNNCSATISIGGYYMTANAGNAGDGTAGLAKSDNAAEAVFWTFESTGQEGKYYIYTWVGEEKRYLNIAASGNGASANATLGSNRQEMTVQYNNNGTYTIYSQSQNNDYYLIQYNGTDGNVFACWNSGASTNPDAQMTFTFNSQNEPGQNYMMLVQYQGGYYIVHNDGALEQVDYRTETQEVRVDNPMLWRYTGDHVYHHSMQAGYDWSSLPSDFYYRYINPTDESALSEDDATNTQTDGTESQWGAGPKIVVRDLMKDTRLEYTGNHKLRSASNPEYYIGVKEENGVLRLCGKADADNAVTVLFADAAYVSHPYWNEHAVNHIDILHTLLKIT